MSKPFVFNDQNTTNSYGFRIRTAGINLKRFNKNPIMLDEHWNSTQSVLGKWENIKLENDLLLGEPIFDLEDIEAAKVAGKVDRGFINSCSMGITFKPEDLKIIGTELVMDKCELYECSIVAVPSNANSVRLYAESGQILKEEEIKQLCLALQPEDNPVPKIELNNKSLNMKKITLSVATVAALGLDSALTEFEDTTVDAAVLKLKESNTTLMAKLLSLEATAENERVTAITDSVALAIAEGRIQATQKQDFEDLGKANLTLLKSTLAAIPAKQVLSAQVVGTGNASVTTKEDFQKLSAAAQLEFKNASPNEYQKLFIK